MSLIPNLNCILSRLLEGKPAEKQEVVYLITLTEPEDIHLLRIAAQNARDKYFKNKVFLYGFLYFSTYCRNNCNFCQYRQSNNRIPRYRKTDEEIRIAAKKMADSGVHLIDLTMGEDPFFYTPSETGFNGVVDRVKQVQDLTGLPVMISPGAVPDSILEKLAAGGVTFYACYQETHNPLLYRQLRSGQGFSKRLAKKQLAKDLGMLVEEGILTGVGETAEDLADSLLWMKAFSVDQARVMTFVPQKDTPMSDYPAQGDLMELNLISVMRLLLPDRLIPASLDVGGLDGLKARLDAGANVVTSIVPPREGLAGVANHSLDIEDSRRTLDHVIPVLSSCGLESAQMEEYREWISKRLIAAPL